MADSLTPRLAAYGSAFRDAVQLLGDDADKLEELLFRHVEGLRADLGEPAPSAFLNDFADALEFIALLVRHRFDYRQGQASVSGIGHSPGVVICLKCEVFPIAVDADVCPVCQTDKWLHVTRC